MRRMRVSCIDNIPAEYVQAVPLSHLMMRRRSEHHDANITTQCSLHSVLCTDTALAALHCEMLVIFPPKLPSALHRPVLDISHLISLPSEC